MRFLKLKQMTFLELITALGNAKTIKTAFAFVLAFLAAHLMPVAHFIAGALFFLVVDFFTGWAAATKRGEKTESKKFRRTIEKFVFYSVAIISSVVLQDMFTKEMFPRLNLVYWIAGFICLTEFKSIIENIGSITGINLSEAIKHYLPNFKNKSNESN